MWRKYPESLEIPQVQDCHFVATVKRSIAATQTGDAQNALSLRQPDRRYEI